MRLTRHLPILSLVLAGALLLAACASESPVAATVNDVDIAVSDVEAIMEGDAATGDTAFADALGTLIQWEISRQAAASQFDIGATDEEIAAEVDFLVAQYGATSVDEFVAAQGISMDLLERYARQIVIQRAVTVSLESTVPTPSDEEVAAEIAANPTSWNEVCAAHFLVETADEADAGLARIAAGEAFADVASEISIDSGTGPGGGDLGCNSPDAYVAEFAAATLEAPIGEPYGPIETEFGFHVILVSSREESPSDDVRSFLTQNAVYAASQDWFSAAVQDAEVTVADAYGTWTTDPVPSVVAG